MRKNSKFLLLTLVFGTTLFLAAPLFSQLSTFPHPASFYLYPVYAQEASESSDLKAKIKAIQDEITTKAAQMKQELSSKLQNKAYIGTLSSKSDSKLEIKSSDEAPSIQFDEFTQYQATPKDPLKKFLPKYLSSGDTVAALGDVDDTGVLHAKQIVLLPEPQDQGKQIVQGTVTEVKKNTITLKTIDEQSLEFQVDSKTKYQLGKAPSTFESVKATKPLIAVLLPQDTESTQAATLKARFIYVLPYMVQLKPLKTSTPSGENN